MNQFSNALNYKEFYELRLKNYENFIQTHPNQTLLIEGIEWKYIVAGEGNKTMLMFHGFAGYAETLSLFIQALKTDCRVIAVSIPAIESEQILESVCRGIKSIVEKEQVKDLLLMGVSMGGMVAQAFFHRNRGLCRGVILCDTYAPDPSLKKRSLNQLRLFRKLPWWAAKILMKLALLRLFEIKSELSLFQRFMLRFARENFSKIFKNLSRDILITHAGLVKDFVVNELYKAEDLANWNGKILIFRSTDDPSYRNIKDKDRLLQLYPLASVIQHSGVGHLGILLLIDQYILEFKNMLQEL